MDDGILGEDPFAQREQAPTTQTSIPNQPFTQDVIDQLRDRQGRFIALAEDFYKLWRALPDLTTRQVDARLVPMYERLLEIAPAVGVSRNGLQQLRECCGKERVWPPGLEGPDVTMRGTMVSPFREEELGWWPGDVLRRFTRWLGVPYCEKCDRRRRAINWLFGRTLWGLLRR